jgi:hypothetical protein
VEKRLSTYLILALLVWAICSSAIAGYYFTRYTTYQSEYNNLLGDLNTVSGDIENVSEAMNSISLHLNTLSGNVGNVSEVITSISLRTNVLVSYGNGTRTWSNNTALPIGSTAFTAILAISDVTYKDYGGTMGILVTSINGLANNSTNGWLYWGWDNQNSTWLSPNYSCSQYILHRGDTIAFSYENYNPWPTSPS